MNHVRPVQGSTESEVDAVSCELIGMPLACHRQAHSTRLGFRQPLVIPEQASNIGLRVILAAGVRSKI